MITYKACKTILNSYPLWIHLLNQHMRQQGGWKEEKDFIDEEILKLWKKLRKVVSLIEAPSKQLDEWRSVDRDFKSQQKTFNSWASNHIKRFPKTKSRYIHIIVCHTVDLWKRFG